MRSRGFYRRAQWPAITSWFAALRIARREARRAKGRSPLVLAMIALPIMALTFAAATYDTFQLTPDEEFRQRYGSADAALTWYLDAPLQQGWTGRLWNPVDESTSAGKDASTREQPATAKEITRLLPPGSRAIPFDSARLTLRTVTGIGDLEARAVDAADPIARGLVTVLAGKTPANAREVALTEQAAERLGVGVGGTVSSPHNGGTWRVTAIVEFPGKLDEAVLFAAGTLPTSDGAAVETSWLVDTPTPVSWNGVMRLNEHGIAVASRAVFQDPPSPSETPWPNDDHESGPDAGTLGVGVLIAGLALLEVVLLAGPAFAVGARRRQRDLALVATNGGTPAHLRRIVLADGVVLGLAGAVIGIAFGVGVTSAALPLAEKYLYGFRAGSIRVSPMALLGIAGLAVLTGLLAALVPAFTAARFNLVAALAGHRGVVRSRKRWWLLGLAVTGAGTAVVVYGATTPDETAILAGLILGEVGLVLCTPALVGLISRVGRMLPPAPRIALRDIARNRSSAAPAISAVMAAVAGSVAIGVYLTSSQAQQEATYSASLPTGAVAISHAGTDGDPQVLTRRMAEAARRSLPVRDVVTVNTFDCARKADPADYCELSMVLPKDQVCPMTNLPGPLTADQQRAARKDPRCDSDGGGHYMGVGNTPFGNAVGDTASLAALTRASAEDLAKAERVLAAGGVVVSDRRYVTGGTVTLAVRDSRKPGNDQGVPEDKLPHLTVPAHVLTSGVKLSGMMLSPVAVEKAGFVVEPAGVLVTTTRMPTQADEDRLQEALLAVSSTPLVHIERGPEPYQEPYLYLLGAAAALITLGAAGIATGLAAADGRADLSTLAAVGASPRVRRLLSLSQSGLISGLGSLLGVAAGLGCAFAVLAAFNQTTAETWPVVSPFPLTVPWRSLLVVGVVPLVAMLGAGLLTRSRLPIERRLT